MSVKSKRFADMAVKTKLFVYLPWKKEFVHLTMIKTGLATESARKINSCESKCLPLLIFISVADPENPVSWNKRIRIHICGSGMEKLHPDPSYLCLFHDEKELQGLKILSRIRFFTASVCACTDDPKIPDTTRFGPATLIFCKFYSRKKQP